MSDVRPETSIVIRAFNEERWLPDVLKAIEGQRYRDFEILLVDSGSLGPDERRRQRGHGLADRLQAGPGGNDPDDGLV